MTANAFWVAEFGDCDYAHDFSGAQIKKSEYGNEQSEFGWNIDHIQPIKKNGPDNISNSQITNIKVNVLKGDKTTFEIDGTIYQVKRLKNVREGDILADYPYEGKKYCIITTDL
ncbi:MAG: hypothetical protein LBQ77_00430 [Treponema sp.]|jgi:hypothetical protein|nr:hypothetical protein [Treponema sp.]